MNYLENIGAPNSPIQLTPLKAGGRADWHVSGCRETTGLPVPFAETDITTQLRRFFDLLDAEADAHKDDPVAMVNALARMEAVLADVRTVTATIRQHAADALAEHKVRRMTIDDLATVEASSASERTDWNDSRLMVDMMLKVIGPIIIDQRTGEAWATSLLAEVILSWVRVQWRLTPIRDAGLNPDDYSTQPTDEDGKPLRTPTVTMKDNLMRREGVTR